MGHRDGQPPFALAFTALEIAGEEKESTVPPLAVGQYVPVDNAVLFVGYGRCCGGGAGGKDSGRSVVCYFDRRASNLPPTW